MILFIALPLPESATHNITTTATQLGQYIKSGRLVDSSQYHITLQYLGHVSEDRLLYVTQAMELLSGQAGLQLSVGSISNWRGTVVAKLMQSKALTALHTTLVDRLEEYQFLVERRAYRPHISIARDTKYDLPFGEVSKCLDVYNAPFVADRVVLYQSVIQEGKTTYKALYTIQLGSN